jgi:hypothetical protein
MFCIKIHFIFFLLAFGCSVFAQETKFVSKKTTTVDLIDYFEEYYVLKSDPNFREGTYVRYRGGWSGVVVLESGNYKNGDKVGLWETYYDPKRADQRNNIKEKGHYVNGKRNGLWMFFHLDTLASKSKTDTYGKKNKPDSINIHIEQRSTTLRQAGMYLNDKRVGEWTSFDIGGSLIQKYNFSTGIIYDKSLGDSINYNINRGPVFLGGRAQLDAHLFQTVRVFHVFDNLRRIQRDSVAAIATFTIDKTGEVNNIVLSQSSSWKKFDAELLTLIPTTENLWIPAIKDGKKIPSTARLKMAVKVKRVNPNYQQFFLDFQFYSP